jgi:peroxiredoxin
MKAFFLGLTVLLLAGGAQAQTPATLPVTITGHVKLLGAGSKVYLQTNSQPAVRYDSTTLDREGRFTLNGRIPALGGIYLLNLAESQKIALLLEGNETLTVEADGFQRNAKTGALGKAVVTGSQNMAVYQQLEQMRITMETNITAWNKQIADAMGKKDNKRVAAIEEQYQAAERETIGKIKAMLPSLGTSLVALYATSFVNPETDFPLLDTLARKFEASGSQNPQVRSFVGRVARIRGVNVGSAAPDIALADTTGAAVNLSSLRGKVILIDFWASWCGPCRNENPNVVRLYNKFKDKGFDIYSVSLDQNRENWVRAIRNDGLTWTHVSDLKYWQSAAAQQYGVNAIPATFLLDKNGVIIAKNLRGEELEQKLTEVLN